MRIASSQMNVSWVPIVKTLCAIFIAVYACFFIWILGCNILNYLRTPAVIRVGSVSVKRSFWWAYDDNFGATFSYDFWMKSGLSSRYASLSVRPASNGDTASIFSRVNQNIMGGHSVTIAGRPWLCFSANYGEVMRLENVNCLDEQHNVTYTFLGDRLLKQEAFSLINP